MPNYPKLQTETLRLSPALAMKSNAKRGNPTYAAALLKISLSPMIH